jgi:hypothetical protein
MSSIRRDGWALDHDAGDVGHVEERLAHDLALAAGLGVFDRRLGEHAERAFGADRHHAVEVGGDAAHVHVALDGRRLGRVDLAVGKLELGRFGKQPIERCSHPLGPGIVGLEFVVVGRVGRRHGRWPRLREHLGVIPLGDGELSKERHHRVVEAIDLVPHRILEQVEQRPAVGLEIDELTAPLGGVTEEIGDIGGELLCACAVGLGVGHESSSSRWVFRMAPTARYPNRSTGS